MHSRATDRRSASKCQGKWPDQTLDQAFGLPEVVVAVSTSRLSCKRAGKTRTLMPVWDSSGESRPNALHMAVLEQVRQRAHDFDLLHFHLDYYPFSLVSRQSIPFVTPLHGRLDLPEHQEVFAQFPSIPVIRISNAQRRPVSRAGWMRT